jgi:beta-lactamase regulating signal transducer with metallopeptidase domain
VGEGQRSEGRPEGPARPGETAEERADRNFGDILQELRVTQTGVQILFGFLLTMPLQARFDRLDSYEKGLLVIAVLLLATATAFIIAPVAWHRALFRHRLKPQIVDVASVFAKCGLAALGLGIVASMLLMLGLVLPRWAATTLGVALGVFLLVLWAVSPVLRRRELDER